MRGSTWGGVAVAVLGAVVLRCQAQVPMERTLGLPEPAVVSAPAPASAPTPTHAEPLRSAPQAAALVNRQAAVRLGARLFFDAALSADGTISCASCHVPERAFSDGLALARGLRGAQGARNTPSLLNAARLHSSFGWDGRHAGLAAQSAAPFVNPLEHGLSGAQQLLQRVADGANYARGFAQAFGARAIEPALVYEALAAFQGELVAGASAFDRWRYGGDARALSVPAQRGYALFVGRAECAACHRVGERGASFSDERFHALGPGLAGLGARLPALLRRVAAQERFNAPGGEAASRQFNALVNEPDAAELGRFLVTHEPQDIGAFRTPSLRNVALTGPYMHAGHLKTLAEALDWELVYRGGRDGRPLILTPDERADLLAFLGSLTSAGLEPLAAWARRMAAD